ncbi:MAG TPA: hypothetical protein PLV68_18075, partial [Ilumatobacteraceae bacterium]|nr:hypothetical protein [Ilumatobacteraceae bacterium]
MHPDPYRDLTDAFGHVTRRPPAWTQHPALVGYGDLDGIVAAIRDDHPDPTISDNLIRTLGAIGQEAPDAA